MIWHVFFFHHLHPFTLTYSLTHSLSNHFILRMFAVDPGPILAGQDARTHWRASRRHSHLEVNYLSQSAYWYSFGSRKNPKETHVYPERTLPIGDTLVLSLASLSCWQYKNRHFVILHRNLSPGDFALSENPKELLDRLVLRSADTWDSENLTEKFTISATAHVSNPVMWSILHTSHCIRCFFL